MPTTKYYATSKPGMQQCVNRVFAQILKEDAVARQQITGKTHTNLDTKPSAVQTPTQMGNDEDLYLTAREWPDSGEELGYLQSDTDNEDGASATASHTIPVSQTLRESWDLCVQTQLSSVSPFTDAEVNAINLLITLRNTKSSLDTYEEVMSWHLRANK